MRNEHLSPTEVTRLSTFHLSRNSQKNIKTHPRRPRTAPTGRRDPHLFDCQVTRRSRRPDAHRNPSKIRMNAVVVTCRGRHKRTGRRRSVPRRKAVVSRLSNDRTVRYDDDDDDAGGREEGEARARPHGAVTSSRYRRGQRRRRRPTFRGKPERTIERGEPPGWPVAAAAVRREKSARVKRFRSCTTLRRRRNAEGKNAVAWLFLSDAGRELSGGCWSCFTAGSPPSTCLSDNGTSTRVVDSSWLAKERHYTSTLHEDLKMDDKQPQMYLDPRCGGNWRRRHVVQHSGETSNTARTRVRDIAVSATFSFTLEASPTIRKRACSTTNGDGTNWSKTSTRANKHEESFANEHKCQQL